MEGTEVSHMPPTPPPTSPVSNVPTMVVHLLQLMKLHRHIINTQSPSFTSGLIHPWWCAFCGVGQMYNHNVATIVVSYRVFALPYTSSVLHLFIPDSLFSDLTTDLLQQRNCLSIASSQHSCLPCCRLLISDK